MAIGAFDFIPVLNDFQEVLQPKFHAPVPENWFLFLSDVRGSTEAVHKGNYKQVNIVGASSIMAVLNATKERRLPYIFGGDGATFLAPPQLLEATSEALAATRSMAKEAFGLDLRVGRVPVRDLYAQGLDLKVATLPVSKHLSQTALSGTALAVAERWVKKGPQFLLPDSKAKASFEGLECRWEPIPNQNGEMLTILVYCPEREAETTYPQVQAFLDAVYDRDQAHPVHKEGLGLSLRFRNYWTEARVKERGRRALWRAMKDYLVSLLFAGLWKTTARKAGERYRQDLKSNSDYRKFDGVLRAVLDSRPDQSAAVETFLESVHTEGKCAFGLHRSRNALATCLIFERSQGDHLHFVDGGDGGYAIAALQLKKRIAALPNSV